jgi:hypothetical protein
VDRAQNFVPTISSSCALISSNDNLFCVKNVKCKKIKMSKQAVVI